MCVVIVFACLLVVAESLVVTKSDGGHVHRLLLCVFGDSMVGTSIAVPAETTSNGVLIVFTRLAVVAESLGHRPH